MMSLLREKKFVCRVSSTLNRDTKQFGKKFLFDDKEETCWNSDQVQSLQFTLMHEANGAEVEEICSKNSSQL